MTPCILVDIYFGIGGNVLLHLQGINISRALSTHWLHFIVQTKTATSEILHEYFPMQ
jgi:hypothetical protein